MVNLTILYSGAFHLAAFSPESPLRFLTPGELVNRFTFCGQVDVLRYSIAAWSIDLLIVAFVASADLAILRRPTPAPLPVASTDRATRSLISASLASMAALYIVYYVLSRTGFPSAAPLCSGRAPMFGDAFVPAIVPALLRFLILIGARHLWGFLRWLQQS